MGFSTTLFRAEGPLLNKVLRAFAINSHDDTPIKIKIGDAYVDVKEVRQVTFGPGEPVCKVLVPVDFTTETK